MSKDELTTDENATGKDTTMTDTESTADTQAEHGDAESAAAGQVNDTTAGQSTDSVDDQSQTDQDDTTSPADAIQFSIVFDDDDTDETVTADLAEPSAVSDAIADAASAANDGESDETAAESASASVESSAESGTADTAQRGIAQQDNVAADNAAKVAQTLSLGKNAAASSKSVAGARIETAAPASLRLSERLDKELGGNAADKVLLKSYPSLALNKVTVTDGKTGHNMIDRVSADFYAGHLYAVRVESNDERVALLSVMTGMMRPHDGAVMNKSLNVLEIEPGELRGHRIGVIPQRYAVRADLNAEQNVLYAMDASGRTFLKPKPVIARELLHRVGFDSETPNAGVGKLPAVQQRLVAIARAISCDAEVIIADEPTGGLDADDSVAVLKTLIGLTHGDPKRCVIIITGSDEVAEVAERVTYVNA